MPKVKFLTFNNIIALLMPALLMAMTVTHDIVYLYLIFALCIIRINKPLVILPVYFVSSLSTGWFAIQEGMSAGRYLSVFMIFSLLVDLLASKHYKYLGDVVLHVVFIFYCLVSTWLSVTGNMDPFFLMLQSLVVLLLFELRKNDDAGYLFDVFIYTGIIVIIGVAMVVFSEGLGAFAIYRLGFNTDIDTNSNRIAMMMAQIGTIMSLGALKKGGVSLTGIFSIAGLLLCAFIIVLTGSRTGLLALVGSFLTVLITTGSRSIKKYFIPVLFLALAVYFALDWLSSMDIVGFSRMSAQDVSDTGGTGRMDAIRIMVKYIFPQYPIFGVGLGGGNFVVLSLQFGMDHPCHNIIFDSLCQLGIVGFTLLLLIVIRVYKRTYHHVRLDNNNLISLLGFALLLTATINGIGETIYLEKIFWNAITLCVIGDNMAESSK